MAQQTARTVHVDGLAALNRSLRAVDAEAAKGLRLALNRISGVLVGRIQRRMPSRSGKARRSVKAASTRTSLRIRAGGRTAPYYPWLDYGGAVGRNRSVRRPFYSDGRYVYPTWYEYRDGPFRRDLDEVLADVMRDAGLEVTR